MTFRYHTISPVALITTWYHTISPMALRHHAISIMKLIQTSHYIPYGTQTLCYVHYETHSDLTLYPLWHSDTTISPIQSYGAHSKSLYLYRLLLRWSAQWKTAHNCLDLPVLGPIYRRPSTCNLSWHVASLQAPLCTPAQSVGHAQTPQNMKNYNKYSSWEEVI